MEQKHQTDEKELLAFTKEVQPEKIREAVETGGERVAGKFFEYLSKSEEIESLKEAVEGKTESLAEVETEIDRIETELAEMENSTINRLINHKKILTYREQLATTKGRLKTLGDELTEESQIMAEAEGTRREISALEAVESSVAQFYTEQAEALEKDREMRDVTNISKKYNVLFVHTILEKTRFSPSHNSTIQMGTDTLTELGIIMGLRPELSCSTIRQGDSDSNMWSQTGVGVILRGGSVRYARSNDAATIANHYLERTCIGNSIAKNEDDIRRAIMERRADDYNELTVRKPEIAGYFVSVEDENVKLPVNEMIEAAEFLDMPIYFMKNGQAFRTKVEGGFIAGTGEAVELEGVLENGYEPDETRIQAVKERIFENSPFKFEEEGPAREDYQSLIARDNGRSDYLELHEQELLSKETYENPYPDSPNFKDARLLYDFKGMGRRIVFTVKGDIIQKTIERPGVRDWTRGGKIGKGGPTGDISRGVIYIEESLNVGLERNLRSNLDYLEAMSAKIKELKAVVEANQGQTENEVWRRDFNQKVLNKLAFHLYGFAQQAGEFGDSETQKAALELAGVIGVGKIEETITKRLGSEGQFRITEDDLKRP